MTGYKTIMFPVIRFFRVYSSDVSPKARKPEPILVEKSGV